MSTDSKHYKKARKAGLCYRCGASCASGTLCEPHRQAHAERSRKWQLIRQARNACTQCGKPLDCLGTLCTSCGGCVCVGPGRSRQATTQ